VPRMLQPAFKTRCCHRSRRNGPPCASSACTPLQVVREHYLRDDIWWALPRIKHRRSESASPSYRRRLADSSGHGSSAEPDTGPARP
jgi:hypothetical protein